MPDTNAHLDDIREGFIETANNNNSLHRHFGFHDTTENENVYVLEASAPQFDSISDQVPIWSDDQFTHIQRLVPPSSASYSINFGEVSPRPVDICIVVGELFEIKVANSDYFQIRRFDHEHTCSNEARFPHQRQASALVIGEHIKEKFRDHRLYKPKEIIQDIHKEFGISCNYHKAYRAKHIALDEVQGTPVESYRILPSYLYMLEQTNPGTIIHLHTDSANRFMYMFFCLKACIDGFLSSIRPVIAIDVKFLKDPHAGVLFLAVCMDGNDQIFPLAFGVGDSETNEAWEWFLSRMHCAFSEVDDLVIVSDRKNSIIMGVEKVFPNSFHEACAVHLERNMLGRYGKTKILKDIFRKAVKVYRARAYSPRKRYNLTSSNIAEAMNNAIKVCREFPITGVIDCIRGVLQRWFCNRRTSADYCSAYYSSAFLAAAYSGEIHPVGHPPEWLVPEDIASIVVLPPVGRRLPGKPKKNRILSFGDGVSKSRFITCHRNGHNSHSCTYSRSSRLLTSTSGVGEGSGSHNV
ncbi:hypothetical protein Ddye_025416 [Dipteronia dyeriana]|uniref:MULE transposase domain-containing protein n=1 Tax=Dipteronia dyeriana TaxID=168575 RepID=A0AAD9WNI2_9ROSI|nr:hypothetical protein Ddye_025416 [Dipteronia dyeriana]